MNILLLGSGGRECAIAWKLAQSPRCTKLFIAPGNAGTGAYGENVAIKVNEFEKIKDFVAANGIEMVVVGPEDPLVNGIYDYFKGTDVKVIGPSKAAAQLEGSKDFCKRFMMRNNIPTARYQSFTAAEYDEACKFLETLQAPYVLKADGLAADTAYSRRSKARAERDAQRYVRCGFGNCRNRRVHERHRVLGLRANRWQELQDTPCSQGLQTYW